MLVYTTKTDEMKDKDKDKDKHKKKKAKNLKPRNREENTSRSQNGKERDIQGTTTDILAALQEPLFGYGLVKREQTREKLQKIPAIAVKDTDKAKLKKLFTNIVKEWTRIVNTGAGTSQENRRKIVQLHVFVLEHNPDLNSLVKEIKGTARSVIKILRQKKNPNQEAIDELTKIAEYDLATNA